jgi:hypothetical protein
LGDRQVDGDPFVADPRSADHAGFASDVAAVDAVFDAIVRTVPFDRWESADVTPGWTLRDHIGHLADWMDEGVRAIDVHRNSGVWLSDPEGGIDAWNSDTSPAPVASHRPQRSRGTTGHGRGCSGGRIDERRGAAFV